jgi:tetratricopeptide (TPR) repeat protein
VHHLIAVGQLARAREIALALAASRPDDARAQLVLSQVAMAQGDKDAALGFADQALERDPDDDAVRFQRALVLRRLGRFAECERELLAVIGMVPDLGAVHVVYAGLLASCDRTKEALATVERALELDPEDSEAHQLFADLLLRVRPKDRALSEEAARRAVALDPDDANAHAVYGLVKLQARAFPEAEEAFRAALSLEPTNRLALQGLSEIVMGRSWLYRPFLWYSIAMTRAGLPTQLMIVAGLWAVVSAGSALLAGDDLRKYRDGLHDTYLALCAYTWFARPITRFILSRHYPWLPDV